MTVLRIAVTGLHGQVVRALAECAAGLGIEVVPVGRPAFDLAVASTVLPALASVRADAIVNAAAYTDVNSAESDSEGAFAANTEGAGRVAAAAQTLGVPVIQLSTDYVFDGVKASPYVESDPVSPISVYGRSKAAGETAVAEAAGDHAILRLAWIYSPFGRNFVRTILDKATSDVPIRVVADRVGCPTSAIDIAGGIATVVRNLIARPNDAGLRGVFHMAAEGDASWADLAEAALAASRAAGGPFAPVTRIADVEYRVAARRPSNSRLNCTRIAETHGIRLPHWRSSVTRCVTQIVGQPGRALGEPS